MEFNYNDFANGWLFVNFEIHAELAFAEYQITSNNGTLDNIVNSEDIYFSSTLENKSFMLGKLAFNISFQLTPHIVFKPFIMFTGAENRLPIWDNQYFLQVIEVYELFSSNY